MRNKQIYSFQKKKGEDIMLLKECYDSFGGSYEDVKTRIPKDELVQKFALKFLDEPSFDNLGEALESENYEEAFRAAHSLKGVSANLSFKRLEASSSELTELLRGKGAHEVDKAQCMLVYEKLADDYNCVIDAIKKLAEA